MILVIFVLIMIGIFLFLSVIEVVRYRAAASSDDEIPYPRKRLIRRLTISAVFSGLLLATLYWPQSGVGRLVYWTAILLTLLIGMVLIWLDLADTSRSALIKADAMNREAARNLAQMIEDAKKKKSEKDDSGS